MDAEVRKCGEQPAEKDATKASDKITATAIKGMIVESGHTCDLSGAVLIPQTATLDHSTPLSRGGEHVLSNVRWVHKEVNRMKGTMTRKEFISWARLIAEHTKGE